MTLEVKYEKVDAALAAALEEAPDPAARTLAVFIHLDPSGPDLDGLAELGVPDATGGGIRTSRLSPRQIAELSHRSSVRQMRLSGRLRLLPDQ